MSKKKNKFDLTHMVHDGTLKDGQTLIFVSDPKKTCKITKQPNGEYKVFTGSGTTAETMTVHAFAVKCLGQEPPDHATRWLKTEAGKTLYEIWHAGDFINEAA